MTFSPSLPPSSASSASDELGWIIELLEKDGTAFQEALADPGPFGESPFLPPETEKARSPVGSPSPDLSSGLLFPDQGSPFAQELLDDGCQTSPYYPSSYGAAGAPSPGSSDVSTAGEPACLLGLGLFSSGCPWLLGSLSESLQL